MTRLVLFVLAISAAVASDSMSSGTIRGSVKSSESQQLLPSTQLHFYTMGKDSISRTLETSTGNFTIIGVPPGDYSCFVSHPGYRAMFAPHIQVKPSGTTEIDFFLRLSKSASDSASSDVYLGAPETDFKMKFYTPDGKDYR